MRVFTAIIVTLVLAISFYSQQLPGETMARFVAYDKFYGWGTPKEPRQTLIIAEIGKGNVSSFERLMIVVYFPTTTGLRGGEQFLESETLNFNDLWRIRVRQPSDREKSYCEPNNFLEPDDIRANKKGEPTLIFHSTQYDADLKFNNLSHLPCMILESFTKQVP